MRKAAQPMNDLLNFSLPATAFSASTRLCNRNRQLPLFIENLNSLEIHGGPNVMRMYPDFYLSMK
jgi:hypothetical protein